MRHFGEVVGLWKVTQNTDILEQISPTRVSQYVDLLSVICYFMCCVLLDKSCTIDLLQFLMLLIAKLAYIQVC